ncbi:MAG: hypothetical protein ACK5MR_15770 [Cumulibacter sp.]
MANRVTFVASGGEFDAFIFNSDDNSLIPIPLGVPFDMEPYKAAQPWDPNPYWIRIFPLNGGEILGISDDPINNYAVWSDESQNGYWQISAGAYNTQTSNLHPDYITTVSVSGGGVEVDSPFNKVFLVTPEIIKEFENVPQLSEDSTDYSQYIISLMAIPFEIPETFLEVDAEITLGDYGTNIQAPVMNADKLIIPLGDVVYSGGESNSLDFVATSYEMFLPFISLTVEIAPEHIVGKTISGEYILDAYSGDITVNLYNGDETPFYSGKSSVGRSIPFRVANNDQTTIGNEQGSENGLTTAYIRTSRRKLQPGNFSNFVSLEGLLEDVTGFIMVEEIALQTSATYSERQQIVSILNGGVIINDSIPPEPVEPTAPVMGNPSFSVAGLTASIEDLGIVSGTMPLYSAVRWQYSAGGAYQTLVNWSNATDYMVQIFPAGTTKIRLQVRTMNSVTMPNYVTGPREDIDL